MENIGIFLAQVLGVPLAIIWLVGWMLDQWTTAEAKENFRKWWLESQALAAFSRNELSAILRIFLNGFLYRTLSERVFSKRFFVRSFILSIGATALCVVLQFLYYPAGEVSEQFRISPGAPITGLFSFAILFLAASVSDYFCNIITVSLLNMAASTGRILDTLIVMFADLATTVTVFLVVFPIGIVASSILNASSAPSVSSKLRASLYAEGPNESNQTLALWSVKIEYDSGTAHYTNEKYIAADKGLTASDLLSDYVSLLSRYGDDTRNIISVVRSVKHQSVSKAN
jgi:hypothetical protein